MIAAVKGWQGVLAALWVAHSAAAADDPAAAARELARKTAAFAGKGAPVAVSWRNVSSLDTQFAAQTRADFEVALQEAGAVASLIAPVAEASVTLSENASQYLLVEEARKGEDRQVWIAGWKRKASPTAAATGVQLEKKLVWEQDEPILDVGFPAAGMLVLSPSKIALYTRGAAKWEQAKAMPIALPKPWPRDPRGRLRLSGNSFHAYLPGMTCSGSAEGELTMDCRPGDEPWVLESGSRAMLLAHFAVERNYFDGSIATQTGVRKTVAPFFSAASVEDQGRTWWLLAAVAGRTEVFDGAMEPAGSLPAWGSDLAGTVARCGTGSQVLATRAGDRGEPDSLQAFGVVNRVPAGIAPPVEFEGPVTALWPAGGNAVLAVARVLQTGRYSAYMVTVGCSE
jgi:hypothetical protein